MSDRRTGNGGQGVSTSVGPANAEPVVAIVYYIPAASAVELYVPSIRACTPFNLRNEPVPSRSQLQEYAEQDIASHYGRHAKDRPAGPVQLEFRPPREDEMITADPPGPAGRPGYSSPSFGHIDPGYVRSHQPRPAGTEPVECPQRWFAEHERPK